MHRRILVTGAIATVLTAATLVAPAGVGAAPPDGGVPTGDPVEARPHDLPNPLAEEMHERRQVAIERRLADQAAGAPAGGPVERIAPGQYVELERTDEDLIWTTLGEFSDLAHNSIPEPDRAVDNSSIWEPDFSEEHYEELLFSEAPGAISMRNFYIELSSNRYTVDGDVTDWVAVPGTGASYGNNDDPGDAGAWLFVDDTVDTWWETSLADASPEELNDYLSQFDVWDRYDYDGDGDFDEPDGYIDHYQAVHAGSGEETGGGVLGADAIWSHRWYVQTTPIGAGGPSVDGQVVPQGGTQIGDSDYWIGDYTIEPEDGGVGVFAHEYAHDLGLPDLYDTAGGENGTGFWTLMSSGSYGNDGTIDLGTQPIHMGAWEKLQLGWLDYEVAVAGERSNHRLGPATTTTKQAQALITILPNKEVTEVIGEPFAGESFYYSGQGNDLDHVMSIPATLSGSSTLSAAVDYDIETDWDYAYVVVSTDGGTTWDSVPTSASDEAGNPNGQDFGHGISGDSGGWIPLSADLSGYSGDVLVGFRYWTDGAVVERGLSVDDIRVDDGPVDGAEGEPTATLDGFTVTDGVNNASYAQYYIAEFRNYRGFDDSLRTGPYNFGFADVAPDLVERFPYQDGLLISLWDTSQSDNNTSSHPGEGLILPIDAHPEALVDPTGTPWRPRIQSYDATFGRQATDPLTLHRNSVPVTHPSLPAASVFDDRNQYWNPAIPNHGVINPDTGTSIRITSVSNHGNFMQVQVRPTS